MKPRLPFSVKKVESLFTFRGGSVLLTPSATRTFIHVNRSTLEANSYGELKGPLKTLSEDLAAITARMQEDGGNYLEILADWSTTLMHGIVSYCANDMNPIASDMARYRAIYEKHRTLFTTAFVAEDFSVENYENLEFLGDGVYRSAMIAFFVKELGIRNKSISTVMKHAHENTKSLSDLAKIFSMDQLVKTKRSKMFESLYEDVFESVIAVLQYVQWELQRDPESPEFVEFSRDNGFANRLIRLIFNHSEARKDCKIAAKTFVTRIQNTFEVGGEKISIVEGSAIKNKKRRGGAAGPGGEAIGDATVTGTIMFTIPTSVVSYMSQIFGCNGRDLESIFNCTYVPDDPDCHAKIFSSHVFENIVERLEEIGITQEKVQDYKNRAIIPSSLLNQYQQISVMARAKGYWLGLNVPKTNQGAGVLGIQCTFYHDDPTRGLPEVSIVGYQKNAEYDVYVNLLAKISEKLETLRPVLSPKTKKNRVLRQRRARLERIQDRTTTASVYSVMPKNPDPNGLVVTSVTGTKYAWKNDLASAVPYLSGTVKQGVAGSVLNSPPRTVQPLPAQKTPSIYDVFRDAMTGEKSFVLASSVLEDYVVSPDKFASLLGLIGDKHLYSLVEKSGTYTVLSISRSSATPAGNVYVSSTNVPDWLSKFLEQSRGAIPRTIENLQYTAESLRAELTKMKA